jgi:hypothetical protein
MLSIVVATLMLLPGVGVASKAEAEIEHLVSTVGSSDCTFIRNGKRHSAEDAEDHLRMKYRRGKKYAATAEDFIKYLASASSWTKKPYYIECTGNEAVRTGDWLTAHLDEYRDRKTLQQPRTTSR